MAINYLAVIYQFMSIYNIFQGYLVPIDLTVINYVFFVNLVLSLHHENLF